MLPPLSVLSRAPALSIKQPWAELILRGRKQIEVRSWSTAYRGFVWLHTGRSRDTAAAQYFNLENLPLGAHVGGMDLMDVIPFDPDRWQKWRPNHLSPGTWHAGLFAWMITNPVRLRRPVSAAGQRGLFAVSRHILEQNLSLLPQIGGCD